MIFLVIRWLAGWDTALWERTAALLGCDLRSVFVKEPRLLSCNQEAIKHERSKSCSKRASCGDLRIRVCPLGVGRDRSRLLWLFNHVLMCC